jgi:hypothetical protein
VVLRRARRCREALIYAASPTLFSLEGQAIAAAERSGAVAAFRGETTPPVTVKKKDDESRQLAESRRLELETSQREKAVVEGMLTSVRAEFAQSQADNARRKQQPSDDTVKEEADATRRAFLVSYHSTSAIIALSVITVFRRMRRARISSRRRRKSLLLLQWRRRRTAWRWRTRRREVILTQRRSDAPRSATHYTSTKSTSSLNMRQHHVFEQQASRGRPKGTTSRERRPHTHTHTAMLI